MSPSTGAGRPRPLTGGRQTHKPRPTLRPAATPPPAHHQAAPPPDAGPGPAPTPPDAGGWDAGWAAPDAEWSGGDAPAAGEPDDNVFYVRDEDVEWDDDDEGDDDDAATPSDQPRRKRLPAAMRCFDTARIYVKGGDGGKGCVAFRREKFVPKGMVGIWEEDGGGGVGEMR